MRMNIKEIREYLRYDTQTAFARALGLSPSAISRLEAGRVHPSFKTIQQLRAMIKRTGNKTYSIDELLEEL